MYRWIVAALVRRTWRKVGAGDYAAAFKLAHPDMTFRFVGDTPLSGTRQGAEAFEAWFRDATTRLPGLRFELRDVVVGGWPWNTRVAVRLDVSMPLPDGTTYRNHAVQWVRLRWGRMVDDWVLEDTAALNAVFEQLEPAVT
jgi:ketosteroid isomerase-like protein